jgi:hypothetical protein
MTLLGIPKDEEMVFLEGPMSFMNEYSRPQIDTPTLDWVLYVGIGLLGIVSKMLRSSYKVWIKYIQDTHSLNERDIIL